MSLEEEVDTLIRHGISRDPFALAVLTGERRIDSLSQKERDFLFVRYFGTLREATLRVAREVDNLRSVEPG